MGQKDADKFHWYNPQMVNLNLCCQIIESSNPKLIRKIWKYKNLGIDTYQLNSLNWVQARYLEYLTPNINPSPLEK